MILDARETALLLNLLRSYRTVFSLVEGCGINLDQARADLENLIVKLQRKEE